MTTPQLIEWLDDKMETHGDGKLIPPQDVLVDELMAETKKRLRAQITARILREAGLEAQVAAAVAALDLPDGDDAQARRRRDVRGLTRDRLARPYWGGRRRPDVTKVSNSDRRFGFLSGKPNGAKAARTSPRPWTGSRRTAKWPPGAG